MCGIFGIWPRVAWPNGAAVRLAGEASASLARRGPDGTGILYIGDRGIQWRKDSGPLSEGTCELMLLHRRLAIIDRSERSAQPMSDASGRYWIVYNGEIYNYRDLRATLAGLGVTFRTESDTEVLLEGWCRWGERVLEKVVGMYAFAIHDTRESTLTLVRDPIGIKPLYYVSTRQHRVAFASDQSTLLRTGVAPAEPDWEGVMSGMLFRGALRPGTAHAGMRAVEPGTLLEFRGAERRMRRYWELPFREASKATDGEVLEESRALLRRVVADALVADVEVASLMSGGLDSTTMSAVAAGHRSGLKAYTLSLAAGVGQDETKHAAAVAQRNGIDHRVVRRGYGYSSSDLLDMFDTYEEPIGLLEPHMPMAAAIQADGIRVVLSGLGPDELLAGYRYYQLLRGRPLSGMLRRLPRLPSFGSGGLSWAWSVLQAPDLPAAYARAFGGSIWGFDEAVFVPELVDKDYDPLAPVRDSFEYVAGPGWDPVRQFSYLDLRIQIGTHHNHTSDRFLMQRSIEGRFPYLDIRWVAHCFNLPQRFKLRGRTQKWLLRQLAGEYQDLPTPGGGKRGFGIPVATLMENPAVPALLEELVRALGRRGLVRQEVLEGTRRSWCRQANGTVRMLYLANLERWLRNLEGYGS